MLYGAAQQGSSSGRRPRSQAVAAYLGKIFLAAAAAASVALYWSRGGFHIVPAPNGNESDALQQAQHGLVGDKSSGVSSGAKLINLRQSGEAGASVWYPAVELDHPWQFKGAVALKSERIAFCPIQKHREHETRDEPAPMAATSAAAGIRLEEAGGDTQTTTGATAVGPSIGEPAAELDSPRGEEDSEASGVVVMLTDPEQMANAVFLKSEKIVYCPIQKVASAEWNRVLRWVDGDPEAMVGDPWKKGTLNRLKDTNIERVNDMLNSPEWLKFAIVRESAHRLLSCFLQKCSTWNMKNEYENCPYLKFWPSLFDHDQRKRDDKTFAVIIKAFKEHGRRSMFSSYVAEIAWRVKRAACAQNGHWAPQYCHCSLDITAPAFQIVGFRNMSEAGASLIVPAVSSPRRRVEVSEFLKSRMGADHDTDSKQTGSDALFDEFYTDDMLAQVHDAFAKDYALFSQFWE